MRGLGCRSWVQTWPKYYHCNCCAVYTIVSYITEIWQHFGGIVLALFRPFLGTVSLTRKCAHLRALSQLKRIADFQSYSNRFTMKRAHLHSKAHCLWYWLSKWAYFAREIVLKWAYILVRQFTPLTLLFLQRLGLVDVEFRGHSQFQMT